MYATHVVALIMPQSGSPQIAVHPSISKNPIPRDGQNLPTVCVLCSHNCGLRVDVVENRIDAVRADQENPITHGYICNKGVTIGNYVNHAQRVENPMRRREDGTFETVDWDTAIGEISAKLRTLRDAHGSRSLGLVGVGGQGNHMDGGFAIPFLRAFGSRRFFNAYAQEKTQHHLVDQWIADTPSSTFLHPDFERTSYLVVMGTNPRISNRGHNPTEMFPKFSKDSSKTVVVLDPRETETSRQADLHLRVLAGSDAWFLMGMAASIVQNELHDVAFLQERSSGFEELRDILCRVDVAEMEVRCGLASGAIEEVARGFAQAPSSAIMYDLGVEQTRFSTLISYLIRVNLILINQFGRDGGNVFLESFAPPERDSDRFDEPERALASGIQAIRALGNFSMFSPTLVPEEILVDHPERIRAMIVEGSNPYLSYSDTQHWKEAREKLELLVVIDPAFTETARAADWVLPTPTGYEKWELALFPKGFPEVMTQVRPPVVASTSQALPEGEIYMRLVEKLGLVEKPPALLRALAKLGGNQFGRGAFMALALKLVAGPVSRGVDEETQIINWLYRLIGPHFESPSLIAVWGLCQMNASKRRDAVLRTLGSDWQSKHSFLLGEELFSRVMAHPEGVEIARLDSASLFEANLGWEDRRLRISPPRMLEEMERALSLDSEDTDYPFVLGNGLRTRWTANTIQRDPAWRRGSGPHCTLHLSRNDAATLGVEKGDPVRIETRRGHLDLPAEIDTKIDDGFVWIPNGFGMEWSNGINGRVVSDGANMNQISDSSDRDPFTGCPHHRYQRCRIEALSATGA